MKRIIPLIYGKQNIFLIQAPHIGKVCDEGAIDHIPKLFIVLKFLIHHGIQNRSAFSYSETSKLGEDVWYRNIILFANPFNVFHDLFDHVLIIELKSKGSFNGKTSANI